jgi:hypothetical protein
MQAAQTLGPGRATAGFLVPETGLRAAGEVVCPGTRLASDRRTALKEKKILFVILGNG